MTAKTETAGAPVDPGRTPSPYYSLPGEGAPAPHIRDAQELSLGPVEPEPPPFTASGVDGRYLMMRDVGCSAFATERSVVLSHDRGGDTHLNVAIHLSPGDARRVAAMLVRAAEMVEVGCE